MQLDLYVELGQRLANLGDAEGSERAWTTVVEMQPNESESHTILAKHREEQGRFTDAVVQWRQVVRVRTKESPGWFGLAAAQKKAGDADGARATLEAFLRQDWLTKEERKQARDLLR
jgi:Flp pilus assembly protein TadD